jgi:hypothetical protein
MDAARSNTAIWAAIAFRRLRPVLLLAEANHLVPCPVER